MVVLLGVSVLVAGALAAGVARARAKTTIARICGRCSDWR